MRRVHGERLSRRVSGDRQGGTSAGLVARALLGITLVSCVLGVAATATATTADFSTQGLTARRAVQQATLTGGTRIHRLLRQAVAVSGDTALVGASGITSWRSLVPAPPTSSRASAGSWTQQAELTAADGAAGDHFSHSVALFGDTALVGAPRHDVSGCRRRRRLRLHASGRLLDAAGRADRDRRRRRRSFWDSQQHFPTTLCWSGRCTVTTPGRPTPGPRTSSRGPAARGRSRPS